VKTPSARRGAHSRATDDTALRDLMAVGDPDPARPADTVIGAGR
jgi:hypothetical protein